MLKIGQKQLLLPHTKNILIGLIRLESVHESLFCREHKLVLVKFGLTVFDEKIQTLKDLIKLR